VIQPSDTIASERLQLDPLTPADADEMVAVLGEPRLYEFMGGAPPTVEALRDRYRQLSVGGSADGREAWRNWIVRLADEGRAIGTVQATIANDGRGAAIAWMIGLPWQGQGLASEAAASLVAWLEGRGVTSITANIHPDHAASASVARRAGLEPTDRMVEGERVWQRTQPKRNAETSAGTDESR
jgi:RimJ/RimL family protein N-acetyltransferase